MTREIIVDQEKKASHILHSISKNMRDLLSSAPSQNDLAPEKTYLK
jgi:hypothetical protein